MIAFNNMSVTFGQLVASAIGAGLAEVPGDGWRGTVGIGAIPALALAGMLCWCPESPRQLVAHGKVEEADTVLQKLYRSSTQEQRLAKIRAIELDIEEATTGLAAESLWTSFKRIFNTPASGRAILTACVVMAISQLGGFNTLMYYSATLFRIVGFSNAAAVAIVSYYGPTHVYVHANKSCYRSSVARTSSFHWSTFSLWTVSVGGSCYA